jgi:hypothetical protein
MDWTENHHVKQSRLDLGRQILHVFSNMLILDLRMTCENVKGVCWGWEPAGGRVKGESDGGGVCDCRILYAGMEL